MARVGIRRVCSPEYDNISFIPYIVKGTGLNLFTNKGFNQTAQTKRGGIVKSSVDFFCKLDCYFLCFIGGSSKTEDHRVFCIFQDRCSLTYCCCLVDRLVIDPENCFFLACFHVGYPYSAGCMNFIYFVLFSFDLDIIAKKATACAYVIVLLHIHFPHTNSIASTGQVTMQPLQRILFFPKRRHSPKFWAFTMPSSIVRTSLLIFVGAFPEPTP